MNSAILALKSDIVTFIAVKSIQVISAFNLKRMKKKWPDGAVVQKCQKQMLKQWYLHGVPGVSKNLEDQSEDHFDNFCSIVTVFDSFFNLSKKPTFLQEESWKLNAMFWQK